MVRTMVKIFFCIRFSTFYIVQYNYELADETLLGLELAASLTLQWVIGG